MLQLLSIGRWGVGRINAVDEEWSRRTVWEWVGGFLKISLRLEARQGECDGDEGVRRVPLCSEVFLGCIYGPSLAHRERRKPRFELRSHMFKPALY